MLTTRRAKQRNKKLLAGTAKRAKKAQQHEAKTGRPDAAKKSST